MLNLRIIDMNLFDIYLSLWMMWSNCYSIDDLKETLDKLIIFYICSLVADSQPDCKASDPTASIEIYPTARNPLASSTL